MKKLKKFIVTLLCISMIMPVVITSAHSGRTDSAGGHHDYKNASGLGSYHYHCGGHPAHLHPNGVCPYSLKATISSRSTVKKVSKYYRVSTVKKVQRKLNKLGYKCGKADGRYGKKTKSAIRKFQRRKGMSVTGKINKKLIKKLRIKL